MKIVLSTLTALVICACASRAAEVRVQEDQFRLAAPLTRAFLTAPVHLQPAIGAFVETPADGSARYYDRQLSVHAAYAAHAAGARYNLVADRVTQTYMDSVSGFATQIDARNPDALEDARRKIAFLKTYVPHLWGTDDILARLGDAYEYHPFVRRDLLEEVASMARAWDARGDARTFAVMKPEDQFFNVPSEATSKGIRTERAESAKRLLHRRILEDSLPSYNPDAQTIAFSLEHPGLEMRVTHGPYEGGHTNGVAFQDFHLNYDPKKFLPWSLVRRTFGPKPAQLRSADVRSTSQSVVLGAEGTQFEIYLKGPQGMPNRDENGPLVMISRDTGRVNFYPPDYNADAFNPLAVVTGLWTDLQQWLARRRWTGRWNELKLLANQKPAPANLPALGSPR